MEEENNITKEAQSVKDSLEMNPPENAWNRLEADLDRKQILIYKTRTNRLKWLSATLAVLLVSFIVYQYLIPYRNTDSIVSKDKQSISANGNRKSSENKTN